MNHPETKLKNKLAAILESNNILSKFFIGVITYFALISTNHAQTAPITGNIPYAKSLIKPDGSLKVWTMARIQQDKYETVKPIIGTVMEMDSSSDAKKLGDGSLEAETKPAYTGNLDLTNAVLPAMIAILVDDIATLTITEIPTGNEPTGYTPFTKTYEVKGTALWNPKSYKEFPIPIPPGRKYDLNLIYTNTANLTPQYNNGKIDVDGVSVYVSLLPVEVRGYSTVDGEDEIGTVNGSYVKEIIRRLIEVPISSDYTRLKTENKSKLKIVQWGDGFIFDANNNSAFDDAEFKRDYDVFRVRLPDVPVPAGSTEHRIKIWTTNTDGTDLDTGAEVDLNIIPANGAVPAFHETAALALVPDDPTDDSYAVEGKEDGHLGDRTYRAKLGGKVKIQWLTAPGNDPKPIIEIPVPAERVVKVKGFLLKGTTDVATAKPWFERSKKIYSAIGVDIQYSFDAIDPLPSGVDLDDDFLLPFETTAHLHAMSPESRNLLDHARGMVPVDTIPVFIVNDTDPKEQGLSNTPSYMVPGD